MKIIFYKFEKKINSTKQPTTETEQLESHVALKESSSFLNPSFLIEMNSFKYWNYCYLEETNSFYYITDIISVRNTIWEIHCTMDLLASYRNKIMNTTSYVVRSQTNFDDKISDAMIPCRANMIESVVKESGAIASDNPINEGGFVLTVIGKEPPEGSTINHVTQGVIPYFLTHLQMQNFVKNFMNEANFSNEIPNAVVKTFFNPFQYVVSCMWIPVKPSVASESDISFGWFTISGVKGHVIREISVRKVYSLNIPWIYQDFRKFEPYTKIKIYVPYCGIFDISPSSVANYDIIYAVQRLDISTGQLLTEIRVGNVDEFGEGGKKVMSISGQCGAQIPLAQVGYNMGDVVSSVGGAIGNAVSFNFTGAIKDIYNASLDLIPNAQSNGAFGNRSGAMQFSANIKLWVESVELSAEPSTYTPIVGRPCFKIARLMDCGGFVQTLNASVEIDGFRDIKEGINRLLDGGTYIE